MGRSPLTGAGAPSGRNPMEGFAETMAPVEAGGFSAVDMAGEEADTVAAQAWHVAGGRNSRTGRTCPQRERPKGRFVGRARM